MTWQPHCEGQHTDCICPSFKNAFAGIADPRERFVRRASTRCFGRSFQFALSLSCGLPEGSCPGTYCCRRPSSFPLALQPRRQSLRAGLSPRSHPECQASATCRTLWCPRSTAKIPQCFKNLLLDQSFCIWVPKIS